MLSALAMVALASRSDVAVTIDPSRLGVKVSPTLYGIFFEEINHAGEGGVYGELLRNRGFESGKLDETPLGWKAVAGTAVLDGQAPFNDVKTRSLRFQGSVENGGFWGIPLRRGERYRFAAWLKGSSAVNVGLGSERRTVQPTATWQRYEMTFRAGKTDASAALRLDAGAPTWVGFASLMPEKSWRNRNLRRDLAGHVEALRPSFVRFPGGCYIEANNLAQGFDWKSSLGPQERRKGSGQTMWGYPSSDGLGYHEYLQWCEDLGAAPLFVANCGISHSDIEPMGTMNRWVQSALDAIEYANGPVTSTWGKRRAENGHPAPFNLKYIEIGNENGAGWSYGGPAAYAERYPLLLNAIKAKYPEVVCIADNPVPHPMEVIDEHYYATPAWFWSQKDRYDRYDRKGPKIYVGEYAVTQDCGLGNLKAALGEAAFMVGMERNSDIVTMSSYAPLLVNVNEKQWNPNAIVFNASQSFGTPSYHVQALFAQNRPDQIVHSTYKATAAPYRVSGGVGVGTWETKAEFRNLHLSVNGQDVPVGDLRFPSDDWSRADGVIRQSSELRDRTAVSLAHPLDGAARYVYQLQARKVSGREGFIIPFGTGGDHALQLNLGGWGNVKHAIQAVDGAGIVSREVPGKIESNRWYDIRIEVEGPQVRTFLDGSPLISYTDPVISRFALNAGIARSNRELIVKCINGEDEARTANVNLTSGEWEPTARAIVMTSGHVNDENTFESPRKIAPRSYTVRNVRSSFPLVVPARSVLILRLRRQP